MLSFLRGIHVVECDAAALAAVAPYIDALGHAEDLDAHVQAVRVRVQAAAADVPGAAADVPGAPRESAR